MSRFSNRRKLITVASLVPLLGTGTSWATERSDLASDETEFVELERTFNGRLGVYALDTSDGAQLAYRANERFPVCSTFKVLLAAAILERSAQSARLLEQRVHYVESDLVSYSPVTERHVENGMTVAELCDAVMRDSDNTAANLLMKLVGGPQGVTAFARSIGNTEFRLDRWETELGEAIPGDLRDTSTARAMGLSLQRLALGDALGAPQRAQLQDWLRSSTTGADLIRAGVPANWQVGNKSGAGSYGTRNDIALLWPPRRPPIVVAVYSTQHEPEAKRRDDIVASAARIVVGWRG